MPEFLIKLLVSLTVESVPYFVIELGPDSGVKLVVKRTTNRTAKPVVNLFHVSGSFRSWLSSLVLCLMSICFMSKFPLELVVEMVVEQIVELVVEPNEEPYPYPAVEPVIELVAEPPPELAMMLAIEFIVNLFHA